MNIANLLQKALEECNWEFVSDVYEMMTGQRIDPPEPDDVFDMLCNISDKIANLESNLLSENKNTSKKRKYTKKSAAKIASKKKSPEPINFSVASEKKSRKISGDNRENKFEQMTGIMEEAEKESGYDKINDDIKPTSRNRKTYSEKNVKCSECDKTFKVHPMFVRENYLCDRCIGRRG
jgi:hypothetical protein